MQLPIMDFILRGEMVVVVEGWFGYEQKGHGTYLLILLHVMASVIMPAGQDR
jgi:hypothetical protein